MNRVRAASFNLNGAMGERASRLGLLLRSQGPVRVALLQEAVPAGLDRFAEAAGLDWWFSVENLFPDLLTVSGRDGSGSSRRPRGVAIAGTESPLRGPIPFPDVPLPEKVLAGWLDLWGRRVTVVSYHAPAGVTHKEKKPAQALHIAWWLAGSEGPTILAGDFNTPAIDPPDHAAIRTHWHSGDRHLAGAHGDDLLVGPNEVHPLRDALRLWLEAHPQALASVRTERPKGPLAISYCTGRGRYPYRYDAIWVSPEFSVRRIEYLYEEALAAGSDHALVVVDLALSAPRRSGR